ncbi:MULTISPECIES: dihydrofolate reductase [unclassified Meiothermus]|uniref:dihydrofolate reductase n=1 Tax=unclassified Meiothermus TaxID=370471 RepID=UPI000D7CE13F|nr:MULTISPECIES: dihydrofolate reductase [unclassified Meiothermus]PZA08182.1 dihydrofolate reductase [Meiothermus sp. Pnk-1]RYM32665.1 dihydrofolate reductase [Meiothermus sp. PNK-Is4]
MEAPSLTLIAAMDRNRAIGKEGRLPWHLPDDLRRFKALTLGHTVLMGRRTFESLGRPLPGRRNVVLSRDPHFRAEGVEVVHSLEAGLGGGEIMVIGGGEVYALTLPLAQRMRLTLVDAEIAGADTFFPQFDLSGWRETNRVFHPADGRHAFSFSFLDLERR